MLKKASRRKNSLINQEPLKQFVLSVIDNVSLLVEQIHDKFSQNIFEAILVRISLISVKTVLMCNDFLLWWLVETRLILQEGLLDSNLDGTLSKLEFSEPDLLQKVLTVHLRFLELSPNWARSSPSHWASRCGILTRLFCPPAQGLLPKVFLSKLLSPRTRRIRGVIRVILCSRTGGISTGQTQHWSDIHFNEPNKTLWLNWFVEAPILCFFFFFADSCNSSWNPSTVEWLIAKGSFLHSAYRYSAISNLFERWGVDQDFSIIPWSTSPINAKFQEMDSMSALRSSISSQIFKLPNFVPRQRIGDLFPRFTSLN